jgi:tetratricopeptide (TPR) repeat protein
MGFFSRKKTDSSFGVKNEKTAKSCSDKGLECYKTGKLVDALKYYDEAISIDPKISYIWSNKGVCHMKLNQNGLALSSFEKCIELDASFSEAWVNKAATLRRLGKPPEEQMTCYDNAIKFLDQNPDKNSERRNMGYFFAMKDKGRLLEELKSYGDALECYENALKIKPKDNLILKNKGLCLAMLGRVADAIASLESVTDGSIKVVKDNKAVSVFDKGQLWFRIEDAPKKVT